MKKSRIEEWFDKNIVTVMKIIVGALALWGLFYLIGNNSRGTPQPSQSSVSSDSENGTTTSPDFLQSYLSGRIINIQFKTKDEANDILALTLILRDSFTGGDSDKVEELDIPSYHFRPNDLHVGDMIKTKWICDAHRENHCTYVGYDMIKSAFGDTHYQDSGSGAEEPQKIVIPSQQNGSPDEPVARQLNSKSQSDDEASIQEAVEGWANAFRARDADRFAAYYALEVEQFFRKKNVSRSQIHDTYQAAFGKMDSIYAYEISGLRVAFPEGELSPARATATYDKTWDTSQTNGKRNSGEEVERLTFEKTDEGWRIVREDEMQVIRNSWQ